MYHEMQRFRQWWLWMIIILVTILKVIVIWSISPNKIGLSHHLFTISIAILFLVMFIFWIVNLETKIDEKRIYYRFNFFHFKTQFISWDEIKTTYVRKYKPPGDFGGWGIRYGWGRSGRAYNVSGNIGLQIILKTEKKY